MLPGIVVSWRSHREFPAGEGPAGRRIRVEVGHFPVVEATVPLLSPLAHSASMAHKREAKRGIPPSL